MRSAGAGADITRAAIAVVANLRAAIAPIVDITRADIMSATEIIAATEPMLAVTTATDLTPTGITPGTIIAIIAVIGITAIAGTITITIDTRSAAPCRTGMDAGGAAAGTLMASARAGACSPADSLSASACLKLSLLNGRREPRACPSPCPASCRRGPERFSPEPGIHRRSAQAISVRTPPRPRASRRHASRPRPACPSS